MPNKGLIKKNYITEKASLLKNENKYVFIVDGKANKSEIKKNIEKKHKINIISVNTIKTNKYKKAIVAVKQGQVINEKI